MLLVVKLSDEMDGMIVWKSLPFMDGRIHQWNATSRSFCSADRARVTLNRISFRDSVTVIERKNAHSFIQCEVT